MGEFHGLDANRGIQQTLEETRAELLRLRRLDDLRDDSLVQLALLTDAAYAWPALLRPFTPHIHAQIRRHPGLSTQLRATFLKARCPTE